MGKTVFKITDEMKEKMLFLYEKGKMDTEIAKELNVSRSAIYYWRKKLNLISKFSYDKVAKLNNKKFEELFKKGLKDSEIAKIFNMTADGIWFHRKRHGYIRNSYAIAKNISITKNELEILIGTLLGDSSMRIGKKCINPTFVCTHGNKQKEYAEYKNTLLSTLNSKLTYNKRNIPDKRNGLYYESYILNLPANPAFLPLYKAFYKNGKKVIPFELFDNFTAQSLAFMYMDDGCKSKSGYVIATMCFTLEELQQFQKFLKNKFNLTTSIHKNKTLYIRACSKDLFISLISPFVCNCMKYKI